MRPRVRRLTSDCAELRHPCIVVTDETADLQQYYGANPKAWLVLLPLELDRHLINHKAASLPVPSDSLATDLATSLATETYLLAQHCDGTGTTQLIHNLRPQHVLFVHGSATFYRT